jgi:hypothetical protein
MEPIDPTLVAEPLPELPNLAAKRQTIAGATRARMSGRHAPPRDPYDRWVYQRAKKAAASALTAAADPRE